MTTAVSDRTLVASAQAGDRQSFQQLYRRHYQKVRSTLYQLCGGDGLDDLVQEVFMRVWKGLAQFRHTAQFSTWLYRITWNVACDRRRVLAQQRERSGAEDQLLQVADPRPEQLMQIHYQELVAKGLAQLSLEHRSVIVLHDLEELPQKEISKILGIPVGTVKSRLFHARAQLRQFFKSQGVEL
ncbi:MAG: sigma-70 family RNA polymerase sigma factor [Pseudanabaenaceae cyanobacterium]